MEYMVLRKYLRIAKSPASGPEAQVACAMREELTERQLQIAEMYFVQQMSMECIARELGINVSTVSRTLARGKKRMRRCLRYGGARLLSLAGDKL
jgi:DNA-directed RNA polymerase specialized sigma subunit